MHRCILENTYFGTMLPEHRNDENGFDPIDENDTDHISPSIEEPSQQRPVTLSPLHVVGMTPIPHQNQDSPTDNRYHYNSTSDYSITNCGSNTPMMTHCPNFNKSPNNNQSHNLQVFPSPPFLALPLVHDTNSSTANSCGEYGASNALHLPSLLTTMATPAFRMEYQNGTTATVTTTNETTPLLQQSPASENYAMPPEIDRLEVSPVLDEIKEPNHATLCNDVKRTDSTFICILYGIINATIVIPVVLTFTTIIYSHPIYHPYLPILTQCTLFSSIVHQLVFSSLSSLPFAIGQVQDAGLIFLSNMAAQLAVHYSTTTTTTTVNIEHLIPTTMMALSVSTVVLGISLILIGYFQLAQYVQLLPTCVVGGYLAYIGYFCGKAGILMMLSSIPDPTTAVSSVAIWPAWYYVLPGVVSGILIYMAIRTVKYMITLPVCILIEMMLFYIVLYCTDTSISDATMDGWIRNTDNHSTILISDAVAESSQSSSFMWYHTWEYLLQFHNIDWHIMLELIPNVIGMIFVVTLSSSLDVIAIEIELHQQYQSLSKQRIMPTSNQPEDYHPSTPASVPSLNYNTELRMIGVSNIVSGCFGGYTGSYIFSQSIFSLRAGIRSRLAGFILALCELIVFVLPIPILSYVPNFLFASLLIMICIDLIIEWLWDVRHRLTRVEYILCLSTFVLIQTFNVEYGIMAGILLYIFLQQAFGWDIGCNSKLMTQHVTSAIREDEVLDLILQENNINADR